MKYANEIKALANESKEVWKEMDGEEKAIIIQALLTLPMSYLSYRWYLKQGAPKWAANGFASLGAGFNGVNLRLRMIEHDMKQP